MRAVYAIVLFAFFGSLCSARADVIISGSVRSYSGSEGTPCTASGVSSSSLSLNCGAFTSSSTQASVTGTADPYGGSLTVNTYAPFQYPYEAMASGQVDLNGTYVLTGGVGTATFEFLLDAHDFQYGDQGGLSCTVTFDGDSQICGGLMVPVGLDLGYDFTFTAEYGVPFSFGLQIDRFAVAFNGEDTGGAPVTFSLNGPGLTLAPEPPSILLLIFGMIGVWFAARLREMRLSGGIPHSSR